MRNEPEATLLVCTFQRPRNLALCLASIARQSAVDGAFELVVSDDGSTDETASIVEAFRANAPFDVHFTTHEHDGFHPARCRNAGVRASRAPYLIFLDGDCVAPPDHVRTHVALRRPGTVSVSDCLRLPSAESSRVASGAARVTSIADLVPWRERWRVSRDHLDARLNWLFRNPSKPKLFANNFSLWRSDFDRVNGFDEKFRGWGGEDDDLRLRLIQAGLDVRSLRDRAPVFHLWHPSDPTAPRTWKEGRNHPFLQRPFRLTRCVEGLVRRGPNDLTIRFRNESRLPQGIREALPLARRAASENDRADIELLVLPGNERFTGNADCNVLVLTEHVPRPPLQATHVLVTDLDVRFDSGLHIHTRELDRLWESIR